ncbi:hypothetical protein M2192_007636 [Bradyrhizobium elkanii USDA 61]|uniref:Uncharacterized protein n=1 Tax=Bradyrhizobium elkanii TaxID=29448 RepID=A0A8I2C3G6_BRAEL|nr:hypothetical protein [Bradyrhizobium elkanii]MCS4010676.1 hypothetical protein [Bradyrhizobium elkanii USDA 61]MCP1925856.1 hypothetical protein [Bradyrhizobium elkanii]MCS3476652.1 hypothetical protein [Bradyrhizobium elkanii]MCS3566483.1 hypothetical protein [Bradyrhizobium elkanii]
MDMSTNRAVREPPNALRLVTQAYMSLLLIAFALMPAQFIAKPTVAYNLYVCNNHILLRARRPRALVKRSWLDADGRHVAQ